MTVVVTFAQGTAQVTITYEQARPVVEALRPNLPAALRGLSLEGAVITSQTEVQWLVNYGPLPIHAARSATTGD